MRNLRSLLRSITAAALFALLVFAPSAQSSVFIDFLSVPTNNPVTEYGRAGSYTFVAPYSGQYWFACIGGGGGSAGGTAATRGTGGGGGGEYRAGWFTLASGSSTTITVGASGTAGGTGAD
ncbi:MAG: hypothetical protein WCP82_04615, partial [Alphaproteobacteria bacterium]